MDSTIPPEVIARMAAHIRLVAERHPTSNDELAIDARQINAMLPSPDLLEARNIVKATLTEQSHRGCNCRAQIDAGKWDDGHKVRATLAGIRRGRELASA